jgi:hypothetical protein
MKLKYRKTIEIYFVLYLAALIFLLPGPDEIHNSKKDKNLKVFQVPFSIQPEKTILNCRLMLDSTGARIVSIDSVNSIIYFGDVEDVDFEFIIEDPVLRQRLSLRTPNDTTNQYFRFTENDETQSARFFWYPPLYERRNKTYNVIVTATARLKQDNPALASDNSGLSNRIIKAQTKFSLNMTYINPELVVYNSDFNRMNYDTIYRYFDRNRQYPAIPAIGDIEIRPAQTFIKVEAQKRWTNFINIYGGTFDKNMLKPVVKAVPEFNDNGGTAEILNIEPTKIVLSGIAPSYGKLKVQLSVNSKFDKKEYSVDFTVSPLKIQEPVYDKIMYPEKTYIIDPQIPLLFGQDTKAMLKEGKIVRALSQQGDRFQFTPDISDTGKILSFERYVDGNLYGQQYEIRVQSYPNPVIRDIQYVGNGEVNVITQSYGFYNKKDNLVNLELDGNAVARELRGQIPEPPDNITHVQIFRCTPKNEGQSFSFRVRAVDIRGIHSEQKSFKE